MGKIIEIRSYNLVPGMRERLHILMLERAMPMLRRWKVDVVAFGPSPHDESSYYLIRAYRDLEDRQKSQDVFYGSDEWIQGPRAPILACIENFTSIVLSVDEQTLRGLRQNI